VATRINFPAICLLLLVLCAQPVRAEYQAGLDAYLAGDYDTAIREWQAVVESPPNSVPPAERAETLYAIGILFWMGLGVEQDIYESASWLVLAAEMNHSGAQNKLGYLYSTGQGVKQSDFEAFKWWQMAANQGDADAQYNLGVLYRDGLGVEPNPDESLKWFREAASNGDAISAGIVAQHDSGLDEESIPQITTAPPADEDIPESAPDEYAADRDWIAERDPQHFTIQVIALSKPENLHKFMAEQPDLEPMAIYRQTRYDKPLWVLVQGDYPNVESARLALQAFPETMQTRDKLWIRRFEMVHRLLE
jgi:tetratricopeptide (TPR) repeat protein